MIPAANILAKESYRKMGFPAAIENSDKSIGAVISYPGQAAGYFVLDVDNHYNGLHTLKRLKEFITFPRTVTAATQQGGRHYYFSYPVGRVVKSQVHWLPGIDVLSDESRHVMPPSLGRITGKAYRWIHSPWKTPIAPAPEKLLEKIT